MASKALSVWLNANEFARFKAAADARGLQLSSFLKACTEQVLAGPDPSKELEDLAANIRSDIAKAIGLMTETAALSAEQERAARQAFLAELYDQQIETVKKAVAAGQGPGRQSSPSLPTPRAAPPLA